MNKKRGFNWGFTLIELLVVIAIIGILAAMASVSYSNSVKLARDAKRKADVEAIAGALSLYYSANKTYPVNAAGWVDFWDTHTNWQTILAAALAPDYVSRLPVDPVDYDPGNCNTSQGCHLYHVCDSDDGSKILVSVNLEKASDPEHSTLPAGFGAADCALGGPNNYFVSN